MKRFVRWVLIGVGGLAGIGLVGGAIVYTIVGNDLDREFDRPASNLVVPNGDAPLAEGERLARVRGCVDGCHGDGVGGAVFLEIPDGTRIVAPDLAKLAQDYSFEQLERAIRQGIRPDGTSVISAMPSNMYYHLSDLDLGLIIAFLRSRPPDNRQLPERRIGPLARLFFFAVGQRLGSLLAAEKIDHAVARLDDSKDDPVRYGRYLAVTSCTECHGDNLRGSPPTFIQGPSLAMVAAYPLEDFRNLMRTGVPIGGRELAMMPLVANGRFAHLTDREIDSLHAYLRSLGATTATAL